MQQISAEKKFLLFCTKPDVTEKDVDRYIHNLPAQFDWDLFIRQATLHRLSALVAKVFFSCGSDLIPEDVLSHLRIYSRSIATRNLFFIGTLHTILALLADHSIPVVSFKGPVLALQAFGDIHLRTFVDLDLLVSPRDAIQTRELLVREGYVVSPQLTQEQEPGYLEKENFFSLFHPTKKVSIDLHWELTGRYSLVPVYLDDLSERLSTVTLAGRDISCLTVEDMMVYVAIHSTSHCWELLEWVTCLSHLIVKSPTVHWAQLLETATNLKCRRMLCLGLFLCKHFYEIPLPKDIEESVRDADVEALAMKIISVLSSDENRHTEDDISWRFSSIHISIRDSFFDKLAYLSRLLFVPTIKEWQVWPLPAYLSFLYYGFRPVRLGWGIICRLMK